MIQSVAEFERLLFELNPDDGEFVIRVDELVEQLSGEVAGDVYPAVFTFFENHPDSDCGAPGTLVHHVEHCFPNYVDALLQSARTNPSYNTTLMLNRILNSEIAESQRADMLSVLHSVSANPALSKTVRDLASDFIQHQSTRGS